MFASADKISTIVATQDTEQLRAKLHLRILATFTLANLKSAKIQSGPPLEQRFSPTFV
jgi:hypothetical protein